MPLSDEVIDRYDEQLLVELTNPRDPKAEEINLSQLNIACGDVEFSHFITYAQLRYDGTNRQHITYAVAAVAAILKHFGATRKAAAEEAWNKMVEVLRDLARVTSRKRVTPYSTSQRTRVPEVIEGENPSPFDDKFFEDWLMGHPNVSGGYRHDD